MIQGSSLPGRLPQACLWAVRFVREASRQEGSLPRLASPICPLIAASSSLCHLHRDPAPLGHLLSHHPPRLIAMNLNGGQGERTDQGAGKLLTGPAWAAAQPAGQPGSGSGMWDEDRVTRRPEGPAGPHSALHAPRTSLALTGACCCCLLQTGTRSSSARRRPPRRRPRARRR